MTAPTTPVKLRDGDGTPNLAARAYIVNMDHMFTHCIGLMSFGGLCVPLVFKILRSANIGTGRDHDRPDEPGIVGKPEVS